MNKKIDDDGAKELMLNIVLQAVRDYQNELYQYNIQRNKDKKFNAKNVVLECEFFFLYNLSAYSALDGREIMFLCRKYVKKRLEKIGRSMEVPTNDRRRFV